MAALEAYGDRPNITTINPEDIEDTEETVKSMSLLSVYIPSITPPGPELERAVATASLMQAGDARIKIFIIVCLDDAELRRVQGYVTRLGLKTPVASNVHTS